MVRVGTVVVTALAGLLVAIGRWQAQAAEVLPEDMAFVTDDDQGNVDPRTGMRPPDGCDEVKIVNVRTGARLDVSHWRPSPGRLAVTSTGSLVLSVLNVADGDPGSVWVRIMVRQPGQRPNWASKDIGTSVAEGGPVAIAPDDSTMLIALERFGVEKHAVADISLTSLGPARGSVGGIQAAEIVYSPDSRSAYLIDPDGFVHIVDVETMTVVGDPIAYTPVAVNPSWRVRNTFASISPDGRYLVINTRSPVVNVVDLINRRMVLVETPDVSTSYDLEFNYATTDEDLLAIHGDRVLAVYRFHGTDPLELLASIAIAGQPVWDAGRYGFPLAIGYQRRNSLAWTGRGDGIIVAVAGQREFRIVDWLPGEAGKLRKRVDFEGCEIQTQPLSLQLDVVTINKPRIAPTPTPTASPTPSATPTALPETATPMPTRTATETPQPTTTAIATVTPTPTLRPTPTATPAPLYLPLLLNEHCYPHQKRADVALVIDTSSSMAGRKLEDAKAAAAAFVGQMDLSPGRDQVAVVRYDTEAEVACQLTNGRAVIEAAIRNLTSRSGTHIDKGLRLALAELQSPRHVERNLPVIVLLTDGIQTGTPGQEIVAAAEVRAAGVRLYTIGLGADVDAATLREMAGDARRYHFAPDSADLARIYAEIASDILCPAPPGGFWPGR